MLLRAFTTLRDFRFPLDFVAKVFLECRPEFSRAAHAFRARRYVGLHRFAQKPPRSFASALRSIAMAESPKNRLLRDFRRRSIFDFCNNICQQRKSETGILTW